jgi:hypothetical protein
MANEIQLTLTFKLGPDCSPQQVIEKITAAMTSIESTKVNKPNSAECHPFVLTTMKASGVIKYHYYCESCQNITPKFTITGYRSVGDIFYIIGTCFGGHIIPVFMRNEEFEARVKSGDIIKINGEERTANSNVDAPVVKTNDAEKAKSGSTTTCMGSPEGSSSTEPIVKKAYGTVNNNYCLCCQSETERMTVTGYVDTKIGVSIQGKCPVGHVISTFVDKEHFEALVKIGGIIKIDGEEKASSSKEPAPTFARRGSIGIACVGMPKSGKTTFITKVMDGAANACKYEPTPMPTNYFKQFATSHGLFACSLFDIPFTSQIPHWGFDAIFIFHLPGDDEIMKGYFAEHKKEFERASTIIHIHLFGDGNPGTQFYVKRIDKSDDSIHMVFPAFDDYYIYEPFGRILKTFVSPDARITNLLV